MAQEVIIDLRICIKSDSEFEYAQTYVEVVERLREYAEIVEIRVDERREDGQILFKG
jgi:hypothetical protein